MLLLLKNKPRLPRGLFYGGDKAATGNGIKFFNHKPFGRCLNCRIKSGRGFLRKFPARWLYL